MLAKGEQRSHELRITLEKRGREDETSYGLRTTSTSIEPLAKAIFKATPVADRDAARRGLVISCRRLS